MIDLSKNEAKIQQNAKHCRERKIKLPTFGQMQNPETIPEEIKDELKNVGLWETHPPICFGSPGKMNLSQRAVVSAV